MKWVAMVYFSAVIAGTMLVFGAGEPLPQRVERAAIILVVFWAVGLMIMFGSMERPVNTRYWDAVIKTDRIRARGQRLVRCAGCGRRKRIPPQDSWFECRRCGMLQEWRQRQSGKN